MAREDLTLKPQRSCEPILAGGGNNNQRLSVINLAGGPLSTGHWYGGVKGKGGGGGGGETGGERGGN